MKETIIKYFVEELGEKEVRAEEMYSKLERHSDILKEFYLWINSREFLEDFKGAIIVEGYSAKKLSETTYLEPIGCYNFLIYLREKPIEAISALKKGLPRK